MTEKRIEEIKDKFKLEPTSISYPNDEDIGFLLSAIASLQRDVDLAEQQRDRGWEERDELKREADGFDAVRHSNAEMLQEIDRLENMLGMAMDSRDHAQREVERLRIGLARALVLGWDRWPYQLFDELAVEYFDTWDEIRALNALTDTGGKVDEPVQGPLKDKWTCLGCSVIQTGGGLCGHCGKSRVAGMPDVSEDEPLFEGKWTGTMGPEGEGERVRKLEEAVGMLKVQHAIVRDKVGIHVRKACHVCNLLAALDAGEGE